MPLRAALVAIACVFVNLFAQADEAVFAHRSLRSVDVLVHPLHVSDVGHEMREKCSRLNVIERSVSSDNEPLPRIGTDVILPDQKIFDSFPVSETSKASPPGYLGEPVLFAPRTSAPDRLTLAGVAKSVGPVFVHPISGHPFPEAGMGAVLLCGPRRREPDAASRAVFFSKWCAIVTNWPSWRREFPSLFGGSLLLSAMTGAKFSPGPFGGKQLPANDARAILKLNFLGALSPRLPSPEFLLDSVPGDVYAWFSHGRISCKRTVTVRSRRQLQLVPALLFYTRSA